jgi:large subunit ribosomal protein L25
MSAIRLEATTRQDIGKGASRRLRRLENKVPAVLYGGDHAALSIHLSHNALLKALENEAIYSSVFDLVVDGKKKAERVILKALQRHPYRPVVLHMDLQRVAATDVLVKLVPLHFLNEEECVGVEAGGVINRAMNQVEVRCEARHLPPFIEVDIAQLELHGVLHLSDLVLPAHVELTVDLEDSSHNHPVVSVSVPKVVEEPEVEAEVAEDEENAEDEATEAADESEGESDAAADSSEESAKE